MSHRTAIVTGSSSGIGQEIARRLHADGFNVVITCRDKDRGEQLREELGPHARFVPLDLTALGPAETRRVPSALSGRDAYNQGKERQVRWL